MNITYLIGNGFDLHLGMDTSPKSFLRSFVEKHRRGNDSSASHLARFIEIDGIETWSDFEMQLGKHISRFNDREQDIDEYLAEVEALETDLHEWLAAEDAKMADSLLETQAEEMLSAFANVRTILKSEGVHSPEITGPDTNLNFVCFNYTSAFPRMVTSYGGTVIYDTTGQPYRLGMLVQPHGTLDSLLVCGVDDVDQIANSALRDKEEIVTSIVKSKMQRADSFDFDIDAMNLIKHSDIICIFGMSLGQSDRRWWNLIGNALFNEGMPLKQLVIFSYELNGVNLTIAPTRLRKKNSIRTRFLSAAEIDESIANRIKASIQAYPTTQLFPN